MPHSAPDAARGGSNEEALFVYGTLRPRHDHPMAGWLAERSTVVGRAWVAGALYDGGGYPVLVPSGSGTVWGDLLMLVPALADATLRSLDAYEDTAGGLFRRQRARITLHERSESYEAWLYVLGRSPSILRPLGAEEWTG